MGALVEPVSERQSEIADLVRSEGFAAIDRLAERFGVSTQTIRKDVNELCERGLLRRVHGGVQVAASGNLAFDTRKVLRFSAKRKIAAHVAATIPNGASIAVSIGSTPAIVIAALGRHRGLKIFTNNLHVAVAASQIDGVSISIAGGGVRPRDGDVIGASAVEFFQKYKVDIGVFGVAAVDEDGGLLDFEEDEVAARQAILRNCRRSYLVLDQMKFERSAHVRGGLITDVSHVFCDAEPPGSIASMLASAGVGWTICEDAGS